MHHQTLQLKDGVLHKQDLEGPKKKGDEKTKLQEAEQEVFGRCLSWSCGCATTIIPWSVGVVLVVPASIDARIAVPGLCPSSFY